MRDRRDDIQAEVAAKVGGLKWIKLVGVGNVASGKTCLIKYFCESKFSPGYQPTVGVDYGFKIETINGKDGNFLALNVITLFNENGSTEHYQFNSGKAAVMDIARMNYISVRVHVWDLSGNDEYYDTRVELYDKTDGAFIVFDVTSQASFDGIGRWYEELNKMCSPPPIIILCGCKIDQSQKRVISKEKGDEWARQRKIGYYEVSSATGENVNQMYTSLLAKILHKT